MFPLIAVLIGYFVVKENAKPNTPVFDATGTPTPPQAFQIGYLPLCGKGTK